MTTEPGTVVRVTTGQWQGWTGRVLETLSGGHLWVRLTRGPEGPFVRALRPDEVEEVEP